MEIIQPKLTARELEVLALGVEGYTAQQMAQRLNCAKHTVDYHLANVYEKLGVSSRLQAIQKARKQGLLRV